MTVDLSNNLFIGGSFDRLGTNDQFSIRYAAKYNTSTNTWIDISGNGLITNDVKSFAVDTSNNVYFTGGNKLLKHLNNTGITINPRNIYGGQFNSGLGGCCVDLSGTVYVVGGYTTAETGYNNNDLSRNGISRWQPINDVSLTLMNDFRNSPNSVGLTNGGNFFFASCDLSNNIYIGGNFATVNGVTNNYITKYNGNTSTFDLSVGQVGFNAVTRALTIDTSNNVYVIGDFTTVNGISANGLAKLTPPLTWSSIPSGDLSGSTYGGYSISQD